MRSLKFYMVPDNITGNYVENLQVSKLVKSQTLDINDIVIGYTGIVIYGVCSRYKFEDFFDKFLNNLQEVSIKTNSFITSQYYYSIDSDLKLDSNKNVLNYDVIKNDFGLFESNMQYRLRTLDTYRGRVYFSVSLKFSDLSVKTVESYLKGLFITINKLDIGLNKITSCVNFDYSNFCKSEQIYGLKYDNIFTNVSSVRKYFRALGNFYQSQLEESLDFKQYYRFSGKCDDYTKYITYKDGYIVKNI